MTQTFLNKKQLSNYLGISIGKIDNLIKNKNIGYYKIGKSVRFKVEDINDWITKYKTTFN
jgi:excisionase family DNA binding protein|tara:strand:+ start:217 stop:396 length:180 start_codon:yes stop_codon:yes gene_type:complete